MSTRHLHTMIRVRDLDESLRFYCGLLGLQESHRKTHETGRFTLVFLADAEGREHLELTHNWDPGVPLEPPGGGSSRNCGHLAYGVDDIYETCQRALDRGHALHRPPRDGRMAFLKSPDGISIELLQNGEALPEKEPWKSMPSQGTW